VFWSPAWRVDLGPGRSGAGTGPGWWKNSISHDSVWPGRLTRQNLVKNRVASRWLLFCFFTKITPFWIFFKIEIEPSDSVKTRWPGSVTRPGLKTLIKSEIRGWNLIFFFPTEKTLNKENRPSCMIKSIW